MECYIYKIINQKTGEKYVGQTTNFYRRIADHLNKLKKHKHINHKLQEAFDKYGEQSFKIEKKKYNLTQEELDELEIEEIKKENSFEHGYNLTRGGRGLEMVQEKN